MMIKSERKVPLEFRPPCTPATLADVLAALEGQKRVSDTQRRDLRSSVKRVAKWLGDDPAHLLLDLPAISAKLANSAITAGLNSKTVSNIRCNFLTAVKASGLKPVQRLAKTPLSPAWKKLTDELSVRRAHIGLSRLARYASANGIDPEQVDNAKINAFIADVRNRTLHRKPNDLHRKVALIWNQAAHRSRFNLQTVDVPSFRHPPKRVKWTLLPVTFRKDVDKYLHWCERTDPYAAKARSRTLAEQTIKLRRNQIHAAVTSLVIKPRAMESGIKPRANGERHQAQGNGERHQVQGIKPKAIKSLAHLVSLKNFKCILRRREQEVGGRKNVFNHDLARALVEIARQWVKVDPKLLAELRRLAGKVPMPEPGLTPKNKLILRQFDDPAVLRRFYNCPGRLWAEVKRDPQPDRRTLAKAQAALAIGIPSFMPGLRLRNLTDLTFGVHLFMQESPGAVSSLELDASEMKNRREIAYDIPPHLANMLLEYRNRIAPKVIGRRPDRLFVNFDDTPKSAWSVARLIRTHLKKRAGIRFSSHKFRHLSAKVGLDAEPGNFETIRQLLGHNSLRTTVGAYAGIDSRRAGRHHQRLIEEALAAPKLTGRQRNSRRSDGFEQKESQ
jgi:integrase